MSRQLTIPTSTDSIPQILIKINVRINMLKIEMIKLDDIQTNVNNAKINTDEHLDNIKE